MECSQQNRTGKKFGGQQLTRFTQTNACLLQQVREENIKVQKETD